MPYVNSLVPRHRCKSLEPGPCQGPFPSFLVAQWLSEYTLHFLGIVFPLLELKGL